MKKTLLFTILVVAVTALTATFYSSSPRKEAAAKLDSLFATLTQEQKHDLKYATGALEVAEGHEANLFASEPMITNPTDIDIDQRGRVWVLEAYNYRPAITGNTTNTEGDRIMILEDTDHDGKADNSKVFYQDKDLNAPLGILVMGNKVLVSQSPYVWLLTDENGDDKADKKEIVFQGVGGEQHDHGMHAFVFGPDGKLYFNFGNSGNQLLDAQGKAVLDQDGDAIDHKKYKQGMVFRCDTDFKNVEVLGSNFRNNYEVAVDSYGTLWQSDNDDDGNKSVRINYVMEYGNYGYTNELTGANWPANRTNIEAEIPFRHWHLNDPGVVPNLLQTGAGSPTGIIVYEGNMLDGRFQNQVIHCDAGPNVLRAYPTTNNGAGYAATMQNLVYGKRNQWFRPSDVCVAPDGSVFVSDWYDPGVGGHQAGDLGRGRIYRITPPNQSYRFEAPNFDNTNGLIAALQSPNMSVRYLAWTKLKAAGTTTETALLSLYKSAANPRMKARALWLLSKLSTGTKHIEMAMQDSDPNLRITALRAARQISSKEGIIAYIKQLANDPNAQVRRECALALHHNSHADMPQIWATLAAQHDGKDRWYLEALGIAAAGNWDKCFDAWLKTTGSTAIATAANRDIVWRARTKQSVPMLAALANDNNVPLKNRLRYFRAFDFNPGGAEKSAALLTIMKGTTDTEINKLCLRHLDPTFAKTSTEAMASLQKLLDEIYGKAEYMELVQRFEPATENPRLLALATEKPMQLIGRDAVRQLLKQNGTPLVWSTINGKDATKASSILTAMRGIGNAQSLEILKTVALDPKRQKALQAEATRAIGGSWDGEEMILALLKEGKIKGELKAAAVQGVSGAWRRSVRKEAAQYLENPTTTSSQKHPEIATLINMKGNAANGKQVFANYCAICHQVNNEGSDFGPKLSEIGSKLAKDGQYLAIMYPSAGVSFGFEGYEITFKDKSKMIGIVASKTETDLILKLPGGIVQNYKMAQVASMKKMDESLMTAGLHENMTTVQLTDLVEYLASLKKK